MNKTKIKYIIIAVLFMAITTTTYCAFVKSVEKTGTIEVKESSTTFLNNTDFLAKVQTLDSSITSVDKNNDLTRSTTISSENLNDSHIVSTSNSNIPTYLWVDSETIYYYTVADTINLNNE